MIVKKRRAFSLVEIMIAILFVSIAFFGYVALHSRLLHSGQKLEEREKIRASTSLYESLEVSRLMLGKNSSVSGQPHTPVGGVPNLYQLNTAVNPGNAAWLTAYPGEYLTNMTETTDMRPNIPKSPFRYSWAEY